MPRTGPASPRPHDSGWMDYLITYVPTDHDIQAYNDWVDEGKRNISDCVATLVGLKYKLSITPAKDGTCFVSVTGRSEGTYLNGWTVSLKGVDPLFGACFLAYFASRCANLSGPQIDTVLDLGFGSLGRDHALGQISTDDQIPF